MASQYLLTRSHLDHALTAAEIRSTMIVRAGLMFGILPLYLVVIVLYAGRNPSSAPPPDASFLNTLSIIHACVTLFLTAAAFYLSQLQMHKEYLFRKTDGLSAEQIAAKAVRLHRASTVIFMAPIEGAAFFGGVVCMLGVLNGTIVHYPVYWCNALSAGVLMMIGLSTFPTRENVLSSMENAFL